MERENKREEEKEREKKREEEKKWGRFKKKRQR
jgi:hypothetical protein